MQQGPAPWSSHHRQVMPAISSCRSPDYHMCQCCSCSTRTRAPPNVMRRWRISSGGRGHRRRRRGRHRRGRQTQQLRVAQTPAAPTAASRRNVCALPTLQQIIQATWDEICMPKPAHQVDARNDPGGAGHLLPLVASSSCVLCCVALCAFRYSYTNGLGIWRHGRTAARRHTRWRCWTLVCRH